MMLSILLIILLSNNVCLEKSSQYIPNIDNISNRYWNDISNLEFIYGQIEQETCPSCKSKKCWNPKAELKTDREYGFGLSQLTITKRFNKFNEAKTRYKELKDWRFEDRYNPDYQLRFIILEDKTIFLSMRRLLYSDIDIWAGTFISYNAGKGTLLKRRALCLSKYKDIYDCTKWFDNLERIKLYGEDKLLYGRSLFERRNEYPHNIMKLRSHKYKELINDSK